MDICKPNKAYFDALAAKMLRMAKVTPEQVERIDINCGSGGGLGKVHLKDGTVISV